MSICPELLCLTKCVPCSFLLIFRFVNRVVDQRKLVVVLLVIYHYESHVIILNENNQFQTVKTLQKSNICCVTL